MLCQTNSMLSLRGGFTLIELVIIISLVGILAAVFAPRLQDIESEKLFFSQEVYTALRYARSVAMNSECSIAVLFSESEISLNREKNCDGVGGFTENVYDPLTKSDSYILPIPAGKTVNRTPEKNFYFSSEGKVYRIDTNELVDINLEIDSTNITLKGRTGVLKWSE